jgi:hypothetical protein
MDYQSLVALIADMEGIKPDEAVQRAQFVQSLPQHLQDAYTQQLLQYADDMDVGPEDVLPDKPVPEPVAPIAPVPIAAAAPTPHHLEDGNLSAWQRYSQMLDYATPKPRDSAQGMVRGMRR